MYTSETDRWHEKDFLSIGSLGSKILKKKEEKRKAIAKFSSLQANATSKKVAKLLELM